MTFRLEMMVYAVLVSGIFGCGTQQAERDDQREAARGGSSLAGVNDVGDVEINFGLDEAGAGLLGGEFDWEATFSCTDGNGFPVEGYMRRGAGSTTMARPFRDCRFSITRLEWNGVASFFYPVDVSTCPAPNFATAVTATNGDATVWLTQRANSPTFLPCDSASIASNVAITVGLDAYLEKNQCGGAMALAEGCGTTTITVAGISPNPARVFVAGNDAPVIGAGDFSITQIDGSLVEGAAGAATTVGLNFRARGLAYNDKVELTAGGTTYGPVTITYSAADTLSVPNVPINAALPYRFIITRGSGNTASKVIITGSVEFNAP